MPYVAFDAKFGNLFLEFINIYILLNVAHTKHERRDSDAGKGYEAKSEI